jgi:RNA polymerase sigma-70 factor (ECF subfamily)
LEDRQVLEQALHHLPAIYRATVLLHEVDGLTLQEIATLLDVPLPTVKSRLQRARMALVTLLDEAAHLGHASGAR